MSVVILHCAAPAHGDLPMMGTYVPELQAVDTLLQNFMMGKPIPGGTITITQHDKVIYERGIGYSNEARTIPMQETALMRLASVSKPITASAIQQLAKDGQLSLDDKVFNIDGNGGILNITPYNDTLGDNRLRDITLQHLLEHKGGWNREIAGDLAFEDVSIATTMGVPSPPGIANSARYILSQPLQFTPGSAEYYSNIGYMFLGMVVEAASGQAYESYVDNHVLAPAGIPTWEVDAGRTFAVDQSPREPVYSDPATFPNVYNPGGPLVPAPYGGWDNEKALAFGGLIASSKAIGLLAQSRIASGPEIGKLRSESTNPQNIGGHLGVLPGTLTLMVQESSKDWTYSILFDGLPEDWSSSSIALFESLNQVLDGLTTWPEALVYAGDFTSDQWLTGDDVMLFKQAVALGSEAAFIQAHPTARYSAGDFDGNGLVNASDAAGLIGALQHAGVPAEYIALVPELPGDFNRDGAVDAADYVTWRKNLGLEIGLPNETMSLGLVNEADHDTWRSNFGTALNSGSGASPSANVPEPNTMLLFTTLVGIVCCYSIRGRFTRTSKFILPIFSLVAFAASAHGDIFQWEYINPADPSQGKRQSTTLAAGGAGVDAVTGADLTNRDLTMAYLIGANLTNAYGYQANLTNADMTGANLAGADLVSATLTDANFTDAHVHGANFLSSNVTANQIYSTASYQAGDLRGIHVDNDLVGATFARQDLAGAVFGRANLTGASFHEANLAGAMFQATYVTCGNTNALCSPPTIMQSATLTDVDFTGAEVRGASFDRRNTFEGTGITLAQLYTTASYQAGDLSGTGFTFNDLTGGNFAGQNLHNANFGAASLADANFRGANLTNVNFVAYHTWPCPGGSPCIGGGWFYLEFVHADLADSDLSSADTRGSNMTVPSTAIAKNLIRPDGHITGVDLGVSEMLSIRDYDGGTYEPQLLIPITIGQHLSMAPGGTLRMVFEADAWDSTISFAPGIPVALGGTLELAFAHEVNPAAQLGRTFHIFDWTGVSPTGAFDVASPYRWDTSNLYTTGEVTLTAIPEPTTDILLALAAVICLQRRWTRNAQSM